MIQEFIGLVFDSAPSAEERVLKSVGRISNRKTSPTVTATELTEAAVAKRINNYLETEFKPFKAANEKSFDLAVEQADDVVGKLIQVKVAAKNTDGYFAWGQSSKTNGWRGTLNKAVNTCANSSFAFVCWDGNNGISKIYIVKTGVLIDHFNSIGSKGTSIATTALATLASYIIE